MAIYRVQGPDGRVHRFEGPDGASPEQVEAFAAQHFGQPKPAPEEATPEDPGFAQSALIGMGRTMDRLGKGVKQSGLTVASALGSDSAGGELASMAAKEAENSRLYAQLQKIRPGATMLGEAAPLLAAPMMGAGLAGTMASAAIPGLMEYGSGSERLSRGAMGAAGGALGRMGGNAIARVMKPTQALSGAQKQAITAADRLGVKLTSGEASGNRALKWAEAASSDMPLASGIASRRIAGNNAAISRAAARSVGQQADEVSEEVLNAARRGLSGEFDRILTPLKIDLSNSAVDMKLRAVQSSKVLRSLRDESVDGLIDEIRAVAKSGPVDGAWFQQNKTALDAAIRSAYNGGQPGKARALEAVEDTLDDAARHAMGKSAGAYDSARRKWANLRLLETGKVVEDGKVLPGRLKSAMESRYKGAMKEGKIKGDLKDIADISSTVRQMPQSGTAPRAIYGGMAGGMAMIEPTTAAAMVAAPTMLQGLTTSPLMRRYMTKGLLDISPEAERALLSAGGRAGLLGAYGASQ